MIFRFLICLLVVGAAQGQTRSGQAASLDSESAAGRGGGEPIGLVLPEYRAPAPPIDDDDSLRAMNGLNDSKVIAVGEQIEYLVIEDREPPEVLLVDEEGLVDVPLIGKISAAGQTPRQFAMRVSDRLKQDYYYQATVMVEPYRETGRRGIVIVMGEVQREGPVEIPAGQIMRVTGAIMGAGGGTQYADLSQVVLTRPDLENGGPAQTVNINVAEILESGRMDLDMVVRANDRIFVGRRNSASGQYKVTGAVRGPGVYPLAIGQQLTVSEAILAAGGFAQFGNGSNVRLFRYDEQGIKTETVIDVEEILETGRTDDDVLLQDGDHVVVKEKWISF